MLARLCACLGVRATSWGVVRCLQGGRVGPEQQQQPGWTRRGMTAAGGQGPARRSNHQSQPPPDSDPNPTSCSAGGRLLGVATAGWPGALGEVEARVFQAVPRCPTANSNAATIPRGRYLQGCGFSGASSTPASTGSSMPAKLALPARPAAHFTAAALEAGPWEPQNAARRDAAAVSSPLPSSTPIIMMPSWCPKAYLHTRLARSRDAVCRDAVCDHPPEAWAVDG